MNTPTPAFSVDELIGPMLDERWSALLDLWEGLVSSPDPLKLDSALFRKLDTTITDLGKAIVAAQTAVTPFVTMTAAERMTVEEMSKAWSTEERAAWKDAVAEGFYFPLHEAAKRRNEYGNACCGFPQIAPHVPIPHVNRGVRAPRIVVTEHRVVVPVQLRREEAPALLRVIFNLGSPPIVEEHKGVNGTGDPIWIRYTNAAIEALAITYAIADRMQLHKDGTADAINAAMRLGGFYGNGANGGIKPIAPSVHTIHQPGE